MGEHKWGAALRRAAPVVLVALLACSESEGRGGALDIDDGASKGEAKSLLVKSSTAATLVLKTGAGLSVPAGAVDKDLEISIKRPPDSEAAELVKKVGSEYRVASAPYVLKPHGTMFQKDVELTLPIAKGDKDRLVVAWLEDESDNDWKVLGTPKAEGGAASIPLKHFSVVVLLEATAGDGGETPTRDGGSSQPGLDAGAGADGGVREEERFDASDEVTCERDVEYGACASGYSFCSGPYTSFTCSDGHTYGWDFAATQDGVCRLQCEIDGEPHGSATCSYESHLCGSDEPLSVCALDCGFPSYVGEQVLKGPDDPRGDAGPGGNDAAAADAQVPDAGTGADDASTEITCTVSVDYGACAAGYSFCVGPFTTYTCSDGHRYAWEFGSVQDGLCQLECQIDGEPVGAATCSYPSHDCDMPGPLSVCAIDCGFPSYVGPQVLSNQAPDAGLDAGTGTGDAAAL